MAMLLLAEPSAGFGPMVTDGAYLNRMGPDDRSQWSPPDAPHCLQTVSHDEAIREDSSGRQGNKSARRNRL